MCIHYSLLNVYIFKRNFSDILNVEQNTGGEHAKKIKLNSYHHTSSAD